MNNYVRFGVILLIFTNLNAGERDPLYKSIDIYLAKYRQSIASDGFSLQNGIIRLEMNGRRTNIQSQLLLGFYSIGRALQRTNIRCQEVQVVIHYELKVGREVVAKAPIEEVLELTHGKLSAEQFFAIIWY